MRTCALIVLVGIAGLLGYFFGVSRRSRVEAPAPLATSHVEVPALTRGPVSDRPDQRAQAVVAIETPRSLKREDPGSAFGEEMEAMRNGDVSAVAKHIVFSADAKVLMEAALASAPPALVQQYSTPELLAAFIFCGAQRIEGFRIESTSVEQPDLAVLRIAYKFASESQWRTEGIAFSRMQDGWRRVIGAGETRRVAAIIGSGKQ